jgi:nicotinamide riboside kinase
MKKKLLVMITIISVMSWILIPGVFADSTNRGNANKDQTQVVDQDEVEDETTDGSKGKADAQQKKEAKDKLVAEKAVLETEKDALESQKDALELEYEAAKESGNTELAEQLATQLESLKSEFEAKKQLMKDKQEEIKATIRATYTSEELSHIEALTEKIKNENKGITVLSVDSIIAKGRTLKFDTPPVIKEGRTLIPVRALTEAFGATVAWDPATQKVTISNGTTEIVLNLESNTAYVNGAEVTIDVAPTTINSRTIVPLRFITETLGLKVDWDDETDTIEIGDDTEETTTETPATDATTETPTTDTATDSKSNNQ